MIRRLAAGILALALGAGILVGGVSSAGVVQPAAAAEEAQISLEPVVYGEPLVLTGTGWVNNDATAGSVMSVLIDAGFSGDPNTLSTKLDVVDPTTGAVSGDKRLHAIMHADTAGTWRVEIPYPTMENSSAGDTSPVWEVGSAHQIRVLSGSLGPNDPIRSVAASFTVYAELPTDPELEPTPDPEPTPEPTPDPEAPEWAHVRIETNDGAVAWVSSDVAAGDNSTIRIRGKNWTTTVGAGASTVALKLNNSADGGQHTHTGADIIQHPSASGDATIWSLLAPSNPSNHPYVVTIDADGNFDIEVPAPTGLEAGDYLSVLFQSGRFDDADVQRTATTPLITVGDVPYEDEGGTGGEQATCVTDVYPSIEIVSESVPLGGELHVRGEGWCHPAPNSGGSVVAFKIDEGGYSHTPENAVHQNLTIWALIEADPEDGTFDTYIQLPDGTSATSTPAFSMGAHTLRLLTGSMKPGDKPRTLQSEEFVVGDISAARHPGPA